MKICQVPTLPLQWHNNAVEKRQFDAWGNVVKIEDGNGNPLTAFVILDRGYTGHEHLLNVGLINMNGRLYDPMLHRFVSPDNHVQDPYNTQNFNRYGYVMNNPLIANDPNGEFIHLIVGAIIGGIVNWAMNGAEFSWKGLAHFGVGAAAGALGAGIGAGINVGMANGSFVSGFLGTAKGVASTGFFSGALTGAGSGFTNAFVSTVGNSLLDGKSFGQSMLSGLKEGVIQGAIGGVAGGIIGGVKASKKDLNFFSGKGDFDISKGIGAHGEMPDSKILKGKFVGNYHGTDVYESTSLGRGAGVTLPGKGIFVNPGAYSLNLDNELMQHEFGHILQAKLVGKTAFYTKIGPASLASATINPQQHPRFWTEVWANNLSFDFFNHPSLNRPAIWSWRFPLIYNSVMDMIIVESFLKK